jgi:hypothetical protein
MNQDSSPNPFPHGTVVSESGTRLADFHGTSWKEAGKLIAVYRENYFAPAPASGLVMGVRGRFGSGKTHLVFQLQEDFAREPLVTRTVYAKIDHPDFLDLYKLYFAPKIIEQLNMVVAMHLAKLLRVRTSGTELGAPSLPNIALKAVDEALASSPEHVLELVEQDLLPVGGLSQALDADVEATSSGLHRDFFRAYTKLREPTWSKAAVRWFEGDSLTPEERDDLGLHTLQIAQPDQARKAMRFLLEVHRKADVPLLLCVDEFERFAVRGAPEDQRTFPGFLKDLAEMFESTGNAFLLCGAEVAWRQLTGDTFDRIRRERIVEVALTDAEAEGLLAVYCENSGRKLPDTFDPGVTAFLIELSERNARRMLNISYGAFELAKGQRKIAQPDVRKAAAEALADDQRFQSMDESVLRVASAQGLGVARQLSVGSATVDYALAESADQPIFLIVMRSSFKTDEVGAGRSAAAAVTEVKKSRPRARAAMIVLGYSTGEVRELLERVADAVLVYDEDRFATELANFLRTSPAPAAKAEAGNAVYIDALQRFADIDKKRSEDFNLLGKQLQAMEAALHSRSNQEQEQRVTDKIGTAITELQGLLQTEQNLTEEALRYSPPGVPLLNLDKVVGVLDSERALVRRLEVLNDGLLEASTLRPVLTRIMYQADAWEERLQAPLGDLPSVRAAYRDRRETLSELELRHIRRLRRELILFGWHVSSRYLALSLFALAGIVFDVVLLIAAVNANGKLLDGYYGWVVAARSQLSEVRATPSAKDSWTTNVRKARGQLDLSFTTAKAGGLPVSALSTPNGELIDAMDRINEAYDPRKVATDGIDAADLLLARKPSAFWVTLGAMWQLMAVGLVPALIALSWWFRGHLVVRQRGSVGPASAGGL